MNTKLSLLLFFPILCAGFLFWHFYSRIRLLNEMEIHVQNLEKKAKYQLTSRENEARFKEQISQHSPPQLKNTFPQLTFDILTTRQYQGFNEKELLLTNGASFSSEEIKKFFNFFSVFYPQYLFKEFKIEKRFYGKADPIYDLQIQLIERSRNE